MRAATAPSSVQHVTELQRSASATALRNARSPKAYPVRPNPALSASTLRDEPGVHKIQTHSSGEQRCRNARAATRGEPDHEQVGVVISDGIVANEEAPRAITLGVASAELDYREREGTF